MFKDLKKRVNINQETQQQTQFFERLDNRPFWIWNAEAHRAADIRINGDTDRNTYIYL